MAMDPLRKAILDALGNSLDGDLFEECMTDVLREIYPTLTPVHGGSDEGMDGAIADGKGLPFPLICTTGKDVLRNLRSSLQSYIDGGNPRRIAVLATSQPLSRIKKKNLEKEAAKFGFTLIQTYDKHGVAKLLYHRPDWSLQLLGVVGNLPPLSILPDSKRIIVDQPLIGREDDLKWLEDGAGDQILSGQPGTGKTFLMQRFAEKNEGLFVLSDDRREILDGIRFQKPKVLLVDDAHLKPEKLSLLRHMRSEMQLDFRIIANCWPGADEEVRSVLGLTSNGLRELKKLTRNEILSIIKAVGIIGPDGLLNELLDQADGLPGLAVTLTHFCLHGDIQEIAFGNALANDIKNTFQKLVGEEAMSVLAAFAIGGNSGMSMTDVAKFLDLSLSKIQNITSKLATGGVLHVGRSTLSVYPNPLRAALVRDVFYRGEALSLQADELIEKAPSLPDTVQTLISAKERRAVIENSTLQALLERLPQYPNEPWETYAGLGKDECEWILENHPEKASQITSPCLFHFPEGIIPILLDEAVGDDRPLNAHPDHTFRRLEGWVERARPGTNEVLERRDLLLKSAIKWHENGGDENVALHALAISLSTGYEFSHLEPGDGDKFTFGSGSVTKKDIENISKNWPKILAFIKKHRPQDLKPLITEIENYVYRTKAISNTTPAASAEMGKQGWKMLNDIIKVASYSPGLQHRAAVCAKRIKRKIEVNLDEEFETIYPLSGDRLPSDARDAKERKLAKELGEKWAQMKPKDVIKQYSIYQKEAAYYDCWPNHSDVVFSEIANKTKDPLAWLNEIKKENLPGSIALFFIERALKMSLPQATKELEECLSIPSTRMAAIYIILKMDKPSPKLLKKALANMEYMRGQIEMMIWRGEIPNLQLNALLRHEKEEIAGTAATALWHWCKKENNRIVPSNLNKNWENSVLRSTTREHFLDELLRDRVDLAAKYVAHYLNSPRTPDYRRRETAKKAIAHLSYAQRQKILSETPDDKWDGAILSALIGNSVTLYKRILKKPKLKQHHLKPLGLHSVLGEGKLALAALDAGYKPEDIVSAILSGITGWSGPESLMWQSWMDSFKKLTKSKDAQIKRIGEIGYRLTEQNHKEAAEREYQRKIRGF